MKEVPLIARVHAFERSIVYEQWKDSDGSYWRWRSFWLIQDVQLTYDALNNRPFQANLTVDLSRERLFMRFLKRLQCDDEQVLVLERETFPVLILEIVPVARTQVAVLAPVPVTGWCWSFVFTEYGSIPEGLIQHFSVLLVKLVAESSSTAIHVELPMSMWETERWWMAIGFRYVGQYAYSNREVRLYSWLSQKSVK